MPGEALLQAAGQLAKGAGDTAIAAGQADTQRLETQQRPGMETARQAMAGQQQMAVEQLKYKMGETEFPPELAMVMSNDFNDASLMQMSGMKMNNRLLGGFIAEKYKKRIEEMKPKLQTTYTSDGKEQKSYIFRDEQGNVVNVPVGSAIDPAKAHPKSTGVGRGGAQGIRADVARSMFGEDVVPSTVPDDSILPPSVVIGALGKSGKLADYIRMLGLERDPITGGLKPGAMEKTVTEMDVLKSMISGKDEVIVEIPPGLDDRYPQGGHATAKKKDLPELLKKGVKLVGSSGGK